MDGLTAVFLRWASSRLSKLFVIYLATVAGAILLSTFVLSVDGREIFAGPKNPGGFGDDLYIGAANFFGLDYGGLAVRGALPQVVAVCEGASSTAVNGALLALIVYKLMRIERKHFIFSNYALLTKDSADRTRLEIRVYNDSDAEMINISLKLRLNHVLPSFPATVSTRMYRVTLNYDDYIHLAPDAFMTVSSRPATTRQARGDSERDLVITDRFLEDFGDFQLILLVQGEFLNSGITFSQIVTYDPHQVRRGYWRYVLKEDLDIDGKLPLNNFSAFDLNSPPQRTPSSKAITQ